MILLARHGETDANAAGRFQGRQDVPLNATGQAQAVALARTLAASGVGAIRSSPLSRARQTADVVASALGVAVTEDERLAEGDTGAWSGLAHADVLAADPEAFARFRALDPSFAPPGGETFAAVEARVLAAVRDAEALGGTVLLVAHTNTLRVLLRAVRGEAPPHGAIPNGVAFAL